MCDRKINRTREPIRTLKKKKKSSYQEGRNRLLPVKGDQRGITRSTLISDMYGIISFYSLIGFLCYPTRCLLLLAFKNTATSFVAGWWRNYIRHSLRANDAEKNYYCSCVSSLPVSYIFISKHVTFAVVCAFVLQTRAFVQSSYRICIYRLVCLSVGQKVTFNLHSYKP